MHQKLRNLKIFIVKRFKTKRRSNEVRTIENHIRRERNIMPAFAAALPRRKGVLIWSSGELGPHFDQQSHMIRIRHFTSLGPGIIICIKKKKLHLLSTFTVHYLSRYTKNFQCTIFTYRQLY